MMMSYMVGIRSFLKARPLACQREEGPDGPSWVDAKPQAAERRYSFSLPLVPKLCLGTHPSKLCFASWPGRETEFRKPAFLNRSLGTIFCETLFFLFFQRRDPQINRMLAFHAV